MNSVDIRHLRYYLFFSSGRCCNAAADLPPTGGEYKVMVCRSESPTGPFFDDHKRPCVIRGGKMILGSHGDVYGPGGQGVLYDEQLKMPVIYYHYMNKTTGYEVEDVYFGWNKLDFDSGWPVLVGDNKDDSAESPPSSSAGASKVRSTIFELLSICVLLPVAVAMLE